MANQPENQNLQALIRDHLNGRTYAELARECGFNNRATVQRLATKDPVDFPSTETLLGLARGLKVSIGAVVSATAVSVGLDPNPYGSSDLIIQNGKTLPKESQDMLINMAAQMLWWHEQYELKIDRAQDKLAETQNKLARTEHDLEHIESDLAISKEVIERLQAATGTKRSDVALAADTSGRQGEGGTFEHDDLPHTP